METNLEKLTTVLQHSELAPEDKQILLEVFAQVDDVELEGLLELFLEDNSWISIINDNFKAKRAAFESGDPLVMEEVLKQEENLLNQIKE
ncbi:hypothetical protein IPH92_02210 [Candidatus Kaiserbacteria bacterium]|nr:MAG: hypothetical protein IPH92_02210 [Candidatus Kaiserbacteria bacterium]